MAKYPTSTGKRKYPYSGIHLRYTRHKYADGDEELIAKYKDYTAIITQRRNKHMAKWAVYDKNGKVVHSGSTSVGWSKDAVRRTMYRIDHGRLE